jgi:hypothetical protein
MKTLIMRQLVSQFITIAHENGCTYEKSLWRTGSIESDFENIEN